MKMKTTFILVNIIIALSIFSNLALAFGVRPSFYQYVTISPGETKEIYFTLQNRAGPDTVSLKPSLSQNPAVSAELINPAPYYTLPVGNDQDIYIRLSAPADAVIGQDYILSFIITTVTPNDKGAFGFGSSIDQQIPIKIVPREAPKVEEPAPIVEIVQEKKMNPGILIAAIILMIGIIITLLIRRKNSNNKGGNKNSKKRNGKNLKRRGI